MKTKEELKKELSKLVANAYNAGVRDSKRRTISMQTDKEVERFMKLIEDNFVSKDTSINKDEARRLADDSYVFGLALGNTGYVLEAKVRTFSLFKSFKDILKKYKLD